MSKYKPPESNDSPDLTPMIDVVFLLIVFFMVVAQKDVLSSTSHWTH